MDNPWLDERLLREELLRSQEPYDIYNERIIKESGYTVPTEEELNDLYDNIGKSDWMDIPRQSYRGFNNYWLNNYMEEPISEQPWMQEYINKWIGR